LCRNRYEVYPYVSKVKICFSCHRIGHINKNCKSKSRCLFCGGDAHDPSSACLKKNDKPACINCQGEHLANSRDCPLIVKHRMILSLAASENIPLIEAKRKILQNTTTPKDIVYDYNNFPLLNSNKTFKDSNHNNSNLQYLQNHSPNIPQYNRFSVLNTLGYSDDTPEYSPSSSVLPLYGSPRSNKPTFSQTITRSRDNGYLRLNKSPQKSEKNNINHNFSAHRKILYSPDGRSPYPTGNGIGYNTHSISNPNTECNSSPQASDNSRTTLSQSSMYNKEYTNDYTARNIDAAMLNSVFFSLSHNIECIYNMVRSIYHPHNDETPSLSYSPSPNPRKELQHQ